MKKKIKENIRKFPNIYFSRTFIVGSLCLLKVYILFMFFDTCKMLFFFSTKSLWCSLDKNCHVINVTYLLEWVQGLYVHKNLICCRTSIFQHNHTLKDKIVHHFKNKCTALSMTLWPENYSLRVCCWAFVKSTVSNIWDCQREHTLVILKRNFNVRCIKNKCAVIYKVKLRFQ